MNCVNCGASIPEIGASTCPECDEVLPPEDQLWEPPLFLDDHRGGVIQLDDHRAEESVGGDFVLATDEEEALAEAFDEHAPEHHPSSPSPPGMHSDRNYYLLTANFGGKVGSHWVQASTDGVAKKLLREYAKDEGWLLMPAAGQTPFPDRSQDRGRYYAAKDAAITVERIAHEVPRDFIYRERSKSRPTLVHL